MTDKRRKFDRSFKLRAIDLSNSRGNVSQVAHELGIRPELLYRWRSQFTNDSKGSFPGNGKKQQSDAETEVVRLEKELAELRMEHAILKKAVGIFSKSDGKSLSS